MKRPKKSERRDPAAAELAVPKVEDGADGPRVEPRDVLVDLLTAEVELPFSMRRKLEPGGKEVAVDVPKSLEGKKRSVDQLDRGKGCVDSVEVGGLVLHPGYRLLANEGDVVRVVPLLFAETAERTIRFVVRIVEGDHAGKEASIDFGTRAFVEEARLVDAVLDLKAKGQWIPLWAQEWRLRAIGRSSIREGRSVVPQVLSVAAADAKDVEPRKARYAELQLAWMEGRIVVPKRGSAPVEVPPAPAKNGSVSMKKPAIPLEKRARR